MKFDDLDAKMRVFETQYDQCVPQDTYMVARLDGRCFTKFTKETHPFKIPFDPKFRDLMTATTRHLMDCGFRILYGYTQSDEISLAFHPNENAFARKLRKLNSTLAAEASAKFSLLFSNHATFDCRVAQLPTLETVIDYFRWRQEDARRNALNAHCHWALIAEGNSPNKAATSMRGMSTAEKQNMLLEKTGQQFDQLPPWQTVGTGLYWQPHEKPATNPKTGESVTAIRQRVHIESELPTRDAYATFIKNIFSNTE